MLDFIYIKLYLYGKRFNQMSVRTLIYLDFNMCKVLQNPFEFSPPDMFISCIVNCICWIYY